MRRGNLSQAGAWLRVELPKTTVAVGREWHALLAEEAQREARRRSPVDTGEFRDKHVSSAERPATASGSPPLRASLRAGGRSFLSNLAGHGLVILQGLVTRRSKRYRSARRFGSPKARQPLYPLIGRLLKRRAGQLFDQAVASRRSRL